MSYPSLYISTFIILEHIGNVYDKTYDESEKSLCCICPSKAEATFQHLQLASHLNRQMVISALRQFNREDN